MPVITVNVSAEALKLVKDILNKTGATTSSALSALLDYFAVLHPELVDEYLANDVVFYNKGYKVLRKQK